MPASLTRTCPRCKVERATPADFRDEGITGPGRPPTFCRACRRDDPSLQAAHLTNRALRETTVERHRRYAARSDAEITAQQGRLYPHGEKTCPEVAGCGRTFPLSHFTPSRHQASGLAPLCPECRADHKARLSKHSA